MTKLLIAGALAMASIVSLQAQTTAHVECYNVYSSTAASGFSLSSLEQDPKVSAEIKSEASAFDAVVGPLIEERIAQDRNQPTSGISKDLCSDVYLAIMAKIKKKWDARDLILYTAQQKALAGTTTKIVENILSHEGWQGGVIVGSRLAVNGTKCTKSYDPDESIACDSSK